MKLAWILNVSNQILAIIKEVTMFKHYIKVAIRQVKRSFLFSSINILGFVLGMTAAFLIYLWIVDELTFEDFNKNGDSIYRVIREEQTANGQVPSTVTPLSETFRKEYPKVENATFIKYGGKYDIRTKEVAIDVNYAFVDTTFFEERSATDRAVGRDSRETVR